MTRQLNRPLLGRLLITLMVTAAILVMSVWAGAPLRSQAQVRVAEPSGLRLETQRAQAGTLVLTSAGRFSLTLDGSGIVAWYNLRRDPQRAQNLVAPGRRLLEHRRPGDLEPLSGRLTLARQGLARSVVRWEGLDAAYTVEYTIWAGGQIAVTSSGDPAPDVTLTRADGHLTGAALQPVAADAAGRTLMLYLDSWTGEDLSSALQITAASPYQPRSGAQRATRAAGDLVVRVPDGMVRSPRFEVANWPGPDLEMTLQGTRLVAGSDYVAEWDAGSGTLTAQYLGLLPATSDAAARSFSLAAQPLGGASLSLGVVGRTLDPTDGRLQVDANLPTVNGNTATVGDLFEIPYIQTGAGITISAAIQGAPANPGVRLVLKRGAATVQTVDASGSSVQVSLTLPAMGEYRLEGFILSNGAPVAGSPDDTIDPLGYGHVFVAVGDSITTGYGDSCVRSAANGDCPSPVATSPYPITSPEQSPQSSADLRNYYQLDTYNVNDFSSPGNDDPFFRGYPVTLNNLLTTCTEAPVFILNDGASGSYAGYNSAAPNGTILVHSVLYRTNPTGALPSLLDHMDTFGADGVLLQIGTNDANYTTGGVITPARYRQGLSEAIANMRAALPSMKIWVARVPWNQATANNVQTRIQGYNTEIASLVASINSSNVALGPDFYTTFQNQASLFADTFHPTRQGYQLMESAWQSTLCPSFPPATATPTGTLTSTPPVGTRYPAALPLVVK